MHLSLLHPMARTLTTVQEWEAQVKEALGQLSLLLYPILRSFACASLRVRLVCFSHKPNFVVLDNYLQYIYTWIF